MKVRPTGFWTFVCNPVHWAIDDFLIDKPLGITSEYMITDWQREWFQAGQYGFIRVGVDNRRVNEIKNKRKLKPGIYAFVQIIGLPKMKLDFRKDKKGIQRYYVPIKYLGNYLSNPVLLTTLKQDQIVIKDPFLIKGHQASSMPLLEEAFNRILLYTEH
jgi:hypothetical protein